MEFAHDKISSLGLSTHVKVVEPHVPLERVIHIMKDNKIGSVVVTEGSKAVGIFTERDFLMKVGISTPDIQTKPVSEFMTPYPKTVLTSDRVLKALVIMRMGRFRHLIVNDDEGNLTNVLSIKDIMDFLCDNMNE